MNKEQEEIKEMRSMLSGKESSSVDAMKLLSSGSTRLDLACSGSTEGAFAAGHYFFFCGDSMCGKTWLGLSCLAEAAHDKKWEDYRLIYDSVEEGALMNIEEFFGRRTAERIEWRNPASETVEDFYAWVDDALKKDKPFIGILDSQDALSSQAEIKKFRQTRKANEEGAEAKGSYTDSKAKYHSAHLRTLIGPLKKTGSILLILNQTRDSFDMFKPASYSGGRALLFYATIQLWGSVGKEISRQIRGKKRQLGVDVRVKIKKNRGTGKRYTVEFPILHGYGIDDIGSCVDYLVSEGAWRRKSKRIEVSGLGPELLLSRSALLKHIEEEELEDDVRVLVQETWKEVEEACKVKRKRRYK